MIDRSAFSKAVVSADYDGDGYPDFFVSNMFGKNFLYHNNQNNTFTEVAEPRPASRSLPPISTPGSSITTTMGGPTFSSPAITVRSTRPCGHI